MLIHGGEWQRSNENGEDEPERSSHGVSLQQSPCRGPADPASCAGGTIALLQRYWAKVLKPEHCPSRTRVLSDSSGTLPLQNKHVQLLEIVANFFKGPKNKQSPPFLMCYSYDILGEGYYLMGNAKMGDILVSKEEQRNQCAQSWVGWGLEEEVRDSIGAHRS